MRVDAYLKNMGPPNTGNTSTRSLDIVTQSQRNLESGTGRTSATEDGAQATGAYNVSLSKKGRALSTSEFQRGQKKEEDRFSRDQQRDLAVFRQKQARENAAFEREQQRKLSEFKRNIDSERTDSVL